VFFVHGDLNGMNALEARLEQIKIFKPKKGESFELMKTNKKTAVEI
jgi:hypothetical protein